MNANEILIPSEYARLLDKDWREAAVFGGRYSLKSHTVARVLLIRAMQDTLRIGCFREFQNSIADSSHQLLKDIINYYNLQMFHVTDNAILNTVNNSDFLFKGLKHNTQNIKSLEGIDIAWIEEAQTISEESLEILTPTIRKPGSQIVYTYNRLREEDPVHKRLVIEGRPNTVVINQNYDIAIKYGWMPDSILNEIEDDKKNRPKLYDYKWMGNPNALESRIYNNWVCIEQIPHEAKLVRRGLDFGYSTAETALVAVYYYNGGYILDEELYRKGMQNKVIADFINSLDYPETLVIADSAEPKSIDEIKSYGINILPAEKGSGSINQGIDMVQYQRISYTKRSKNLEKEYKNYLWQTDKDGKIINVPEDIYNHCMDSLRYSLQSLLKHTTTDAGIIDTTPQPDAYVKSFIVTEDGSSGFTHDIGKAIKETQWQ